MKELLIIGAGGQGKVVADIAVHCGYEKIAFLDDNENIKSCLGFPVIGTLKDIYKNVEAAYIVAIGNASVRENIQTSLINNGLMVVSLIHPDAVIAQDVTIGLGTAIMAGVVINPGTSIGDGCIINTAATIDHDNRIDDYVHISVGSHLAGTVVIGKGTWIGVGAVVSNNVTVCGNTTIGAGAVVIRKIVQPGIYVGVPALKK